MKALNSTEPLQCDPPILPFLKESGRERREEFVLCGRHALIADIVVVIQVGCGVQSVSSRGRRARARLRSGSHR